VNNNWGVNPVSGSKGTDRLRDQGAVNSNKISLSIHK
jgi:hypothetical protein